MDPLYVFIKIINYMSNEYVTKLHSGMHDKNTVLKKTLLLTFVKVYNNI